MLHFCTVCDYGYLSRTIALLSSLQAHCPDFRLYILCLDDQTYQWATQNSLDSVTPIHISVFTNYDHELASTRNNRSIGEYACTCKASFMLYLLAHDQALQSLSYLDSDLYFVADPNKIYKTLSKASIYITPHRYSHHLGFMRNRAGIYNAGWVHINRNESSLACLKWWREQSIAWCFHRLENGQFGEQRYLEQFAQKFEGVVEVTHNGFNLAPWNINDVTFTRRDGLLLANNDEVVMLHFHGLKLLDNRKVDMGLRGCVAIVPDEVLKLVFEPYIQQLLRFNISLKNHTFKHHTFFDRFKILVELLICYFINQHRHVWWPRKILDSWFVSFQ